jgi:hypothetical protein
MWTSQDAWILQSVVYAGRRGDLRSVLGNADAINVDIPSRDQIEASARRLEAAGLVKPDGARLRATRAGKRLVRQSGRWRQGIRTISRRLEGRLKEQVPFPERVGQWTLSREQWQRAYESYRQSARDRR